MWIVGLAFVLWLGAMFYMLVTSSDNTDTWQIKVYLCGGIGRRAGFKFQCPKGRVGSTPTRGTMNTFNIFLWLDDKVHRYHLAHNVTEDEVELDVIWPKEFKEDIV